MSGSKSADRIQRDTSALFSVDPASVAEVAFEGALFTGSDRVLRFNDIVACVELLSASGKTATDTRSSFIVINPADPAHSSLIRASGPDAVEVRPLKCATSDAAPNTTP